MQAYYKIIQSIENFSADRGREKKPLSECLRHVLQEDVVADMNMPPFDKSAMDGFACRMEDIDQELEILETIQAGKLPGKAIGPKQCSRIMTGAAVPQGADCVFMMEDAVFSGDKSVTCNNPATKRNICYTGEDYKQGDVLINKGGVICPAHIGTLASAGYAQVAVSKMPGVGILATGTELVEPSEWPAGGQIRNSNSYQVMAQLWSMGIRSDYHGIIVDDIEAISKSFEKALKSNDVVIITGGASQGDFDFVPAILQRHGFEIVLEKTGIQPGNPMSFSRKKQQFCFGLSGNPVSSFVQFELFVKPFLYKIMGANWEAAQVKGRLAQSFKRNKGHRFGIVPVRINSDSSVAEIGFHGSAHINSLAHANALMEVPVGVTYLKEGEEVNVRLIQ